MNLRISNNNYHPSQFNQNADNFSLPQETYVPIQNIKNLDKSIPFTKKTKSHKKHFVNNQNEHSHLKYLGTCEMNARLESIHDKLDIKDIPGASPDYFRNQIFKNRMYGKKIDRKHIFSNTPTPTTNQEEPSDIKHYLPKINVEQPLQNSPKLKQQERQFIKPQPHSIKLSIDHDVIAMNYPNAIREEKPVPFVGERRRIKTQLDNPERYFREYKNSPSRQLRKWNPTYLTDTSNPLLQNFLPRIK